MSHEKAVWPRVTLIAAAPPLTYAVLRVLRAFVRAEPGPDTRHAAVSLAAHDSAGHEDSSIAVPKEPKELPYSPRGKPRAA
jgi:hypothetical protein